MLYGNSTTLQRFLSHKSISRRGLGATALNTFGPIFGLQMPSRAFPLSQSTPETFDAFVTDIETHAPLLFLRQSTSMSPTTFPKSSNMI